MCHQQQQRKLQKPQPSSLLYDYVLDLNWEKAKSHALKCPLDASYTDDEGETPLFLACQLATDPPLSLIQTLIHVYPEAVILPQGRHKYLPIHIACRYDAPIGVLKVLLDGNAKCAVKQSKWGKTPLVALCDGDANRRENYSNYAYTSSPSLTLDEEKEEGDFWEKIQLLLKASWSQSNISKVKEEGNTYISPLHAASRLGIRRCPRRVFELCFLKCPQYARIPYNNSESQQRQQYPLHSLLSAPLLRQLPNATNNNASKIDDSNTETTTTRNRFVLERIIQLYPKAASTPVILYHHPEDYKIIDSDNNHRQNNHRYRIPLHYAISKGISWEDGLDCIFFAYPDAIFNRDPISHLYPFMLAATTSSTSLLSTVSNRKVDGSIVVNTIFMLLSSQPDVLKECVQRLEYEELDSSCTNPVKEDHFKKKLEKEKDDESKRYSLQQCQMQ